MRLSPKNWDKFQQYKDRKPQWIKLQRDLLNDFSYASVRIGTKATLPLLWLLSSEYDDGIIEASVEEISFRIHIDSKTVQTAIDELLSLGFYSNLDANVQDCTETYEMAPREEKRRDREETEREEEFTFSLSKNTHYSKLNSEYKNNLKTEILKLNGKLKYDDFILSLESNSKYKYINFLSVYKKWNNGETSKQQPQSFKQQDEMREQEKSNTISKLLGAGFNPFSQADWDKLSEHEARLMQEHQGVIDVQPTQRIS